METIKSYTDKEQSKKLAEILPLESADMCYPPYYIGDEDGDHLYYSSPLFEQKEKCAYQRDNKDEYIPCWSLAALLKLLPQKIEHEGNEAELHINSRMTDLWYENDNFIYFGTFAEKLIDACVQLICTLNEKGLL